MMARKAALILPSDLKAFLDEKVILYNRPGFIENDPICIPHQFTQKQDIEIMGFWSAMLAWGQRKTIINKCNELIDRMDGTPYDFIINHQDSDLKALLGFKHRTFNDTDALYFVEFFKQHYTEQESLETAFLPATGVVNKSWIRKEFSNDDSHSNVIIPLVSSPCYAGELSSQVVEDALNYFRGYFFSLPDFPRRTIKHVSSPLQKSTCKRLNMFLRWMVRDDNQGVDFGMWKSISPADLICPTDLHVERVARKLKLITRAQVDWKTAVELTQNLRTFDAADPVKYDFALFGLGIEEQFQNQIL